MKRRSTLTPTISQKQEASPSPSFLSLRVAPSIRNFLPFFSLLFAFPLVLACSRSTTPTTAPHARATPNAVWILLPQAEDWLKEIQQPPPPLPSQPCDRCERSIRRKLAKIRIPPYPLPPDPAPARILLVLRPQGLDLWINGRAITQGCNLWGSLLMQHPILPTLPQSTLQRDPNALAACFQEVRRCYPNEQRILLLAFPHTPTQTTRALRDTLFQLPISPPFRFFARTLLPPSNKAPKHPYHRLVQQARPSPKQPPHRGYQHDQRLPSTSTRPSGKQGKLP